jgi:type I restriction enzyme S subunit
LLVPKLRFKEFNNEWEKIKLKDISTDISYGMNSAATEYDGINKYIRITDIDEETSLYSNNPVSPSGNLDDRFLVRDNDILFARTGASTGKAYLYNRVDGKLYFAGFLIRANIKRDYNSRFIFEQTKLNKYNNWIKIMSIRSGQPGINSIEYGNYEFSITNINEQNKISKLLTVLNKKIELQQRKIEALKIYKKGLINKLLNSNESLNCKNIKLNNILIPGSKERVVDTSKFQKINIKLNLNGLSKNNSSREMADTRPFYIRNLNEIIIGKQNYFNGSIAIVTKEFDGCICSNAIMSFSVKNDNPKYIYYYISQPNYIRKRSFLANGTGQKELSEKEFLNFEINLPSIEKQNYIVTILDFVESKISIENLKYELLELFKKSLLQQMFI